jgi:hypothetical protein
MTLHRYWFVDVQKMPKSEGGYIGIIEAREGLTGWVEAAMIKSMKSEVWVKFIYENILCRYGVVGTIISDNGELNSKLGLEFAEKYGVQLIFTTTYHPQGNAPVERGHQPLRRSLERSVFGRVTDWLNFDKEAEKVKWPKYFHAALWADRVSVRRQLGYSPYYLLYGQQSVLPIELEAISWYISEWTYPMETEDLIRNRVRQIARRDLDMEKAVEKLKVAKENSKRYFDKNRNLRVKEIREGDLVLLHESMDNARLSRKFRNSWTGPYVVHRKLSNGTYEIGQLDDSARELVAGNRLKLFSIRQKYSQGTTASFIPVDVVLSVEDNIDCVI